MQSGRNQQGPTSIPGVSLYQKHDLAMKHRKILLYPTSLGSAK